MKNWQKIGEAVEVLSTGRRGFKISSKDVVVFKIEDKYYCLDRWCPHRGGDLAEGAVFQGPSIKCPFHGFIYDLLTGKGLNCRGYNARTYETKEESGGIFVKIG